MEGQQEKDWETGRQEGSWDNGERGALETGDQGGGSPQQLGSTTLGSCQAFKFPTSYFYRLSPPASAEASEEVLDSPLACFLQFVPASHVFWASITGGLLSTGFRDLPCCSSGACARRWKGMGATSIPQLPRLPGRGRGGCLAVALVYLSQDAFLCVSASSSPLPHFTGLLLLGKCWLPPPLKEPVIWVPENDAYIKLSSAGETD